MKKGRHPQILQLFILATIIVLASGCGGGGSPQAGSGADSRATQDTQTSSLPAQSEETSPPAAAQYAVGETFTVNNLTWTVISSEQFAEVESAFSDTKPHQPANGAWLVVTLDFQGYQGLAGGFDIAALKVRDASGKLYDVAEPGGAADDYRLTHEGVKNLSLAMLDDTARQRVFAIYDVPASGGPFTLEWLGVADGALVTIAKVQLSN